MLQFKYSILCILLLAATVVGAENVTIADLRIWPSPGNTRMVFDLSEPVKYKIFTLPAPERVVIDFDSVVLKAKLQTALPTDTQVSKIRVGDRGPNNLRIVFETKQALRPKAFLVTPTDKYGHRLIVDLESSEKQALLALFDLDQLQTKPAVEETPPSAQVAAVVEEKTPVNKPAVTSSAVNNTNNPAAKQPEKDLDPAKPSKPQAKPAKRQVYTIALDPGHGGEDPGAIGPGGTKEKDVVLRIAKILKQLINKEPNLRAFLIRDGDYYVGLKERMLRARQQKADLFISIHADAYEHPRATGSSVFILSERGASSAAAGWLAESENRSDSIGGVSLEDKGNTLASVLLDLSQTANEKESLAAASSVLNNLGKITQLHKPYVERAGFAVLKAPDVPSFLVETGFISNPKTEKDLKNHEYNRKLANQMLVGIRKYFASRKS